MKNIWKIIILFLFININVYVYGKGLSRDIDIIDMPLHDVLAILSKETGKNLICSKESKDIAIDTYFNKGDDIDEVLDYLAETYDLALNRENETVVFMLLSERSSKKAKIIGQVLSKKKPIENAKIEIKELKKAVYTDKKGNYIFEDIPKDIYLCKISKDGYEEKGDMLVVSKQLNIMNVELEESEKEKKDFPVDKLINDNFYESSGKFYYTKTVSVFNISPDEVIKILKETFGDNIKTSSLARVNKLVLNGERDVIENALNIIQEIDQNPKQVKITSEILDISNNLFEELGFNWWFEQHGNQAGNWLSASILGGASTIAGPVAGGTIKIARQFNNQHDILNLGINLLEQTNDLVVNSVPTLTIASGEEGEFKITEEVVVGLKTKRENRNDRVSEPVFKEAGLIMKVKPFIKEDDYINLDISLELSDFKLSQKAETYNSEGGSKIGRSISTKVRVKNGDTILLGGLKKSIQHSIENKIPILGDIPIINFFFKNISKKKENSDMYIKLKVDIEK